MVVGKRQQHDRMADANLAGALRNCAVEDLGRRAVREPNLKVMLDGPEIGEADFLGAHHLVHHIVKGLVLALAMLERTVDLDLIKNPKSHRSPRSAEPPINEASGSEHGCPQPALQVPPYARNARRS